MAQTLHRVLHRPIPRLSTVVKDIDPTLDEIVARSLQKDPAKRFQTAQEMRDALEGYIAKTGRFVRQEDLARIMGTLFKSRRERIQQQVKAFMAAAHESISPRDLPSVGSAHTHGTTPSSKGDTGSYTPTSSASESGSAPQSSASPFVGSVHGAGASRHTASAFVRTV